MKHVFPFIPQRKVRHFISAPFEFQQIKEKIICYFSRRLSEDSKQVVKMLELRNTLKEWKIVDINEKSITVSPDLVANVLNKSAIFLSFSSTEGFGLPPAEAMKCGCIVIGYTGYGGRDYFREEFSYPIEERNVLQFVQTIEDVVLNYDKPQIQEKGLLASDFISRNYNEEIEREDIKSAWEDILYKVEKLRPIEK